MVQADYPMNEAGSSVTIYLELPDGTPICHRCFFSIEENLKGRIEQAEKELDIMEKFDCVYLRKPIGKLNQPSAFEPERYCASFQVEPLNCARLTDLLYHGDGRIENDAVLVYFFKQLLEAISHMHGLGYAHRDIRPEIVYFHFDENCLKLLDFDLANDDVPN